MKNLIGALLALAAGCAGVDTQTYYAGQSAGKIGCRAREITISEFEWNGDSRTWTATCRGRTYFCGKDPSRGLALGPLGPENDDGQVSCAESARPQESASR